MSQETHEWLSNNVLIGFTEKRGNAWHYREGDQNHYEGPVPVEDVHRRLFDWEPEGRPLYVPSGDTLAEVPGRMAVVRSDNGHVLGVHKDSYNPHSYSEWLVANVSNFLGGDLAVGSAGLLRGGAVAWVQAEMPENIATVDGVEFRPFFHAFSSLDGTFSSTYKLGVTNVVCDNTMRAAQNEGGPQIKIKSTKNSRARVQEVRDALGLVVAVADEFSEQVHKMCSQDFTDYQFERLVSGLTPAADDDELSRGRTMAEKKRDSLWSMWREDSRVRDWNGTAWGAYQALNTYNQHEATVKGGNRAERNMLNNLSGKSDAQDADALARIAELV